MIPFTNPPFHLQPTICVDDKFYKIFPSKEFQEDASVETAKTMYDNGYHPDILAGVWRGGAYAAAPATGILQRLGVKLSHFSVAGKSYSEGTGEGEGNRSHTIQIYNMGDLTRYVRAHKKKRLCFFDDIIDTGVTGSALETVAHNGLSRKDAVRAYLVEGEDMKKEIPVDEAMKLTPGDCYVLYEYLVPKNGTSYTIQAHMVCDIQPVDAEIRVEAPMIKPYANLTGVESMFHQWEFDKINDKPVWVNFTYELEKKDITDEEMAQFRPNVERTIRGRS